MRTMFAALLSLLPGLWVYAAQEQGIDRILAQRDAPPGIVFEVVQSNESALEWAIPEIKKQAQRLRERFPGLKIAVVSHGKEQFALLKDRADRFKAVHDGVRELGAQDDIPLHVCGTHAGWYQKSDRDFPAYVDVAPSGPMQIRAYRDLGYVVITLIPPNVVGK